MSILLDLEHSDPVPEKWTTFSIILPAEEKPVKLPFSFLQPVDISRIKKTAKDTCPVMLKAFRWYNMSPLAIQFDNANQQRISRFIQSAFN